MKDNQAKYPQLRFKGFTDSWEQRKLGEVGKTQSGIGFPDAEQGGTEGVPFYKVSDMNKPGNEHEMVNANNYVNYEQLSRKKWKIIETVPAVIFAKVGAAIMLNRKRLVTSPFLIDNNTMAYVFDGSWNIDFGKTLFETINLPRYAQVGALPSYNGSDIESIEVTLPNKGEQVKLGAFFKSLDDTITLHQREYDLLQKTKKSFLQKLFPKNGETKPEIRFSGFTDAWEQRKLGEIFNERSEKTDVGELISVTIKAGVIKASELDRKDNSSSNKSNYKVVKKGDIAYNSMRMWQGASGYSEYDGIVSPAYTVISPRNNISAKFISYVFKKTEMLQIFQRNSQGLTSDTWNLKFPALSTINLLIPNYNEQIKISVFMEQLDYLIALHQRKLDLLKEQKKGFLQKMFC